MRVNNIQTNYTAPSFGKVTTYEPAYKKGLVATGTVTIDGKDYKYRLSHFPYGETPQYPIYFEDLEGKPIGNTVFACDKDGSLEQEPCDYKLFVYNKKEFIADSREIVNTYIKSQALPVNPKHKNKKPRGSRINSSSSPDCNRVSFGEVLTLERNCEAGTALKGTLLLNGDVFQYNLHNSSEEPNEYSISFKTLKGRLKGATFFKYNGFGSLKELPGASWFIGGGKKEALADSREIIENYVFSESKDSDYKREA